MGLGGLEPPPSSLSAKCKEPLCRRLFPQVARDRRCRSYDKCSHRVQLLRGRSKSVASQAPELRECEIGITPFDCPRDKCSSDAARSSSDTARSLLLLQHAPPSSLPSTRADDSHYATAAAQSAPGRPIFLGPTDLAEAAIAVRSCSMYWLARSAASQPAVGGRWTSCMAARQTRPC